MSLSEIIFEHINNDFAYGKYGDFTVIIMKKNRYINATKLCKEYNKLFKNWLRNDENKILINEVDNELKKSADSSIKKHTKALITLQKECNNTLRGTYVHPDIMPNIIKWMKNPRHNQPEFQIQQKLNKKLNGMCEVSTKLGIIDILTDDKIIEIKHVKQWKSALGQILIYSRFYPNHTRCIHLFGTNNNDELLDEIEEIYSEYDIELTYE